MEEQEILHSLQRASAIADAAYNDCRHLFAGDRQLEARKVVEQTIEAIRARLNALEMETN